MRTTRLLLPFTHGVNGCALEHAIRLAKSLDATLVPLSLIRTSKEQQSKGVRPEYMQQSKDFLEMVRYKAIKYAVPVESLEVFTNDVVQSIEVLAQEMACEGILLFTSVENGVLLHINEIKHLMERGAFKLYLIRLETKNKLHHQSPAAALDRHRYSSRASKQG